MAKETNKEKMTDTFDKIPIQYNLPIEEIRKLPKNRRYNLLDIGAGMKDIKPFLPKNQK